jgi:hypothetical protein
MLHSSSLKLNPVPAEEEEVCWMEKEALVKEEEAVTIQKQVEGEAVTVKEEEKDTSRVKDEDEDVSVKEEMTVTSKNDVEEEGTGYLGPVSQGYLKASNGFKDEWALINTSKYSLKNRSTNSAVVELMYGVKGEVSNCYIHILTFKLFIYRH